MRVAEVIAQIQHLPNTYVGCGFRQGRRAVLQHFLHRLGSTSPPLAEREIARARRRLARLTRLVAPHSLPRDYRFFLEHYAELTFGPLRDSLYFSIFGVGPRTTAEGDVVEYQANVDRAVIDHLYIALWSARVGTHGQTNDPLGIVAQQNTRMSEEEPIPFSWVQFYLDLAGTNRKDCVVVKENTSQATHQPGWRTVASSFTDWIEWVAVTGGTFGYALTPDEAVDF